MKGLLNKMEKIKLFCIPYAGGAANTYNRWKKYFDDAIELYCVELPGRGRRMKEPLYSCMEDLVEDVYNSIKNELSNSKYAIFGHSMGSVISYELYHRIKRANKAKPIHMFFSGRFPPHIKKKRKIIHNLPFDELKEELLKFGGTPKEVFQYDELLDIYIPLIRSDFKILEEYEYIERDEKIGNNISIFYGEEEDLLLEEIEQWKSYTNMNCQIYSFKGDHFFIHKNEKMVTRVIENVICNNLFNI